MNTPAKTRRLIVMMLVDMRLAKEKADEADALWSELNEAYKLKISRQNAQRAAAGRPPMTDKQVVEGKSAWIELSDAFAVQGWWQAKYQALGTAIIAEKAALEMLGYSDADVD